MSTRSSRTSLTRTPRTPPLNILILTLILTSACSGAAAQPANVSAPTPTTTFAPQVVIYEPTPTLTPTDAPTATATPIPPTSTPAATPTPSPDQIDPFTGLVVTDTKVLDRRPLLIKVANTTEVRPQAGLAQADVVVEHYAEGGITRFSALFLANTPARVGSVRSCRMIDIELPAIFGSSLTCSGTSNGVRAILLQSNYLFDQDGYPTHGVAIMSDFEPIECPTCPMFRVNDRPAPHNLFANPLMIWKELDQRGKNLRTTFSSWTFDNAPLTAGRVVTTVRLPYTSGDVNWMYDAPAGKWMRFEGLVQHTDAETGKQLGASNVVVLFAPHVYTSIQEDAGGSRSIRIELWGEGKLRLYRDGRAVDGVWQRAEDSTYTLSFNDTEGKLLALKPGNTWIELAPPDFKVKD